MALDNIKNFFKADGDDDDNRKDEVNNVETNKKDIKKLVSSGSKMILLEPRAYSESQQIADHLKEKNSVVVNLKRVTTDQGKRIVDFLSGTVYAIGGDLQKLGTGIFLCTPSSVNVEGKISDEADINEENSKKSSKKATKDFDYEW